MASGNSLYFFNAQNVEPLGGSWALYDTRNYHPILTFEQDNDTQAVFSGVLPQHYAGGGVTVYIHWAAETATTGDVRWDVAFERVGENTLDIDGDSFASAQSVTATAPGVSGRIDIASTSFTDGAQMDSLAVGEGFRLKITRDANNVADTMADDAQLRWVEIRET